MESLEHEMEHRKINDKTMNDNSLTFLENFFELKIAYLSSHINPLCRIFNLNLRDYSIIADLDHFSFDNSNFNHNFGWIARFLDMRGIERLKKNAAEILTYFSNFLWKYWENKLGQI